LSESKSKSVGLMPLVALLISEIWIVMGYVGNLYGAMTTVGYNIWFLAFTGLVTVANLILIPFAVKENKMAFLAAIIIAAAIFLVILVVGPVYQLATSGWENSTDYMLAVGGGIVWLILQVPVMFFSYKAYRKL
jgi:cytochrome c oxidase assembly factor CtaG